MPPFRAPPAAHSGDWPLRVVAIGVLIAGLYLGREVLAPLALALLLTVAVLPVCGALEHLGLPRIPAAVLVVLLVITGLTSLAFVVSSQAIALAEALPQYETVLRDKIATISEGSGPFAGIVDLTRRLGPPSEAQSAVPVVVVTGPEAAFGSMLGALHLALPPLAMLGIAMLLMAFILVHREDVRDRALRIAGIDALHRSTRVMGEATERLSRFLLMQVVINASFGTAMGLGLWLIGLPNAPLWGVLGFTLRFIPFVGAPLSALFPMVIAFATADGWGTVLGVVALFIVVDLFVTYVLEPWLYGQSTGISPLALLLASAFWGLLWGPVGLVLAPALTACLLILGRHLPGLGLLDVALGDRAPLPPPDRFYHRLLAEDASSAARLLATESERLGVTEALDGVVVPAIARLAAIRPADRQGPAVAVRGARTLMRTLELVGEPPESGAEVLVLPLAAALDHAAAAAVAALLSEHGFAATTQPGARVAPLLTVLVGAADAPTHRIRRQLRNAAMQGGDRVVLALTPEAGAALAEAGARGVLTDTTALLTAAAERLALPEAA